MNKLTLPLLATLPLFFFACKSTTATDSENKAVASKPQIFKIAFGSCGQQTHPLPVLNEVVKHQPDLFVFLGDNIYGDTHDMAVLRKKYQQLGSKASYQNLKKHVPIVATWDDHDYGRNDAGKEYPHKEKSKEIFLEFFEEPKDSERFQHEGIYTVNTYQVGDKTVQLILLDGRTFRDPLKRFIPHKDSKKSFYRLDYTPHTDRTTTLLGQQQWQWLEKVLMQPADFRVLATGTQFAIEANGYEAWANFPHEQERLVKLIKKTRANHLVAISGDVHYAEISKFTHSHGYPIYDITASGLSQRWHFATPNHNRIEGPIMENHFGLLTIDFSATQPNIKTEIWDGTGNQRIEYTIPLKDISFDTTVGNDE